MKFGSLDFVPALEKPELLAKPTADFIGSGIRGSKILFDAKHFESLPNVTIMDIAKH